MTWPADKANYPMGRAWMALPSDPSAPMKYTTKDGIIIPLTSGIVVPSRGNTTYARWLYLPPTFTRGRYRSVIRWGSDLGDWNDQPDVEVIWEGDPTPAPPKDGADLFFVMVAGRYNKVSTGYQNQPDQPTPTFYIHLLKKLKGPSILPEEPVNVTALATLGTKVGRMLALGPVPGGATPLDG